MKATPREDVEQLIEEKLISAQQGLLDLMRGFEEGLDEPHPSTDAATDEVARWTKALAWVRAAL